MRVERIIFPVRRKNAADASDGDVDGTASGMLQSTRYMSGSVMDWRSMNIKK